MPPHSLDTLSGGEANSLEILAELKGWQKFCCRADQPLLCSLAHHCIPEYPWLYLWQSVWGGAYENDKKMFRSFKLQ